MIFLRNLRLKPFQCFLYKIRSVFISCMYSFFTYAFLILNYCLNTGTTYTPLLTKRDGHRNDGNQVHLFLVILSALCWSRLVVSLGPSNFGQPLFSQGGTQKYPIPLIHRPSKILIRLSKTMHSAASLRKKGKTLSLPWHAHSKHMGRRNILLGQGIFQKCPIKAKNHISFSG